MVDRRRIHVVLVRASAALMGVAQTVTADEAAAATCTLILPRRIVLQAQADADNYSYKTRPYLVGARWGKCPATFRKVGYSTFLSDYEASQGEKPLQAVIRRFEPRRLVPLPSAWNDINSMAGLTMTSFDGETPQVGFPQLGGESYYQPIVPGTYRFTSKDSPRPRVTNFPEVKLRTSRSTIVARYRSALSMSVNRQGSATVIMIVGTQDRSDPNPDTGLLTAQPNAPAAGAKVRVLRGGTLIDRVTLDHNGTATVTALSSQGSGAYRAVMAGTAMNWPAYASATPARG